MADESVIEEWRPVVGFEGFYDISNLGRVRSLKRACMRRNGVPITTNGRILRGRPNRQGYFLVDLRRPRERKKGKAISRLVAEAFLGVPRGMVVDHIDRDVTNDVLLNLRIATYSQNGANAKCRKDNPVGMKGVYTKGKRFGAHITINWTRTLLGVFDTPEEAHAAYCAAAVAHFGVFARAK